MPILTIFHKGHPILRESLDRPLTIGSDPDNDICLLDSVAPHHARLEVSEGEVVLIERDGQVFANGERVVGSQTLKEGDLFDLGAYRFQVRDTGWIREKTATASIQGGRGAAATLPTIHFLSPIKKAFRRSTLLIGRSPGCDLVVENSFVSTQHAEIFAQGGAYIIRDLHSRNGSFVNDFRVTERPLPSTGTIRLGRYNLTYEIETPRTAEKRESAGIPLGVPGQSGTPRMLIGRSPVFRSLLERLKKIAPSNDSILLLGETGVGKDLLAHYLHQENPKRRGHPLVIVNCATIPQALADSQLFGHVRGAFTGAVSDYQGFFQQAHRGTLFLDEIGELPLESQARLLRVIEDGQIRPVGGTRETSVDVRILFATNRDLDSARYSGGFREDLYQRFDWIINVPPLRDRKEDIPLLVNYFLSQHAPEPLEIGPGVMEYLRSQGWRGNIRELHRAVRRAITQALARESRCVERCDFEFGQGPKHQPVSEVRLGKRESLSETLKTCGGNINHAAKSLGISRVTIYQWIKEDGIDLDSVRNAR